jgi:hypothetical protein
MRKEVTQTHIMSKIMLTVRVSTSLDKYIYVACIIIVIYTFHGAQNV